MLAPPLPADPGKQARPRIDGRSTTQQWASRSTPRRSFRDVIRELRKPLVKVVLARAGLMKKTAALIAEASYRSRSETEATSSHEMMSSS
jgi:hypothetical protein